MKTFLPKKKLKKILKTLSIFASGYETVFLPGSFPRRNYLEQFLHLQPHFIFIDKYLMKTFVRSYTCSIFEVQVSPFTIEQNRVCFGLRKLFVAGNYDYQSLL